MSTVVYCWPISFFSIVCQFAIQEAWAYLQPCCPAGRCLLLIYSQRLFCASVYVGSVGGVGEIVGAGILVGTGCVLLVGGGLCLWVSMVGTIGAAVGCLVNHSS
jgi:hypothetical protein